MKPKILVIDDSADSWALLNAVLQSHGYAPVWAADGMQAMSVARTHQPQAILLDLGLPGGDGFLILERLKANKFLSHVPVIVITVRPPNEGEEKALKLGAVSYLPKPINVDTLLAVSSNSWHSQNKFFHLLGCGESRQASPDDGNSIRFMTHVSR